MPQNESYPEFTPSFLPSSIKRKNKTERDCAELLLKELVVWFVIVCPYDAGRIPTADRNLIRKAERAIERAEAER